MGLWRTYNYSLLREHYFHDCTSHAMLVRGTKPQRLVDGQKLNRFAEVMTPSSTQLTFKKHFLHAGMVAALWRLDNGSNLEASYILLQKVSVCHS